MCLERLRKQQITELSCCFLLSIFFSEMVLSASLKIQVPDYCSRKARAVAAKIGGQVTPLRIQSIEFILARYEMVDPVEESFTIVASIKKLLDNHGDSAEAGINTLADVVRLIQERHQLGVRHWVRATGVMQFVLKAQKGEEIAPHFAPVIEEVFHALFPEPNLEKMMAVGLVHRIDGRIEDLKNRPGLAGWQHTLERAVERFGDDPIVLAKKGRS